eukprot:4065179-Alexandrium_andersonii.AAC.1
MPTSWGESPGTLHNGAIAKGYDGCPGWPPTEFCYYQACAKTRALLETRGAPQPTPRRTLPLLRVMGVAWDGALLG